MADLVPTQPDETNYEAKQQAHSAEYRKEWDRAPESWKKKVAELGLSPETETMSAAVEIHEGSSTMSYTPDMAATIDTHLDLIIETIGFKYEPIIRKTAEMLMLPMAREIEMERGMMLGRVTGFILKADKRNALARVHQILHAIPRLAAANGFPTMRASARECGCSVEWIKRGRDECCTALQIPIPVEGTKSAIAKVRYKMKAKMDHWRLRKFKPIQPNPCKPIQQTSPLNFPTQVSP